MLRCFAFVDGAAIIVMKMGQGRGVDSGEEMTEVSSLFTFCVRNIAKRINVKISNLFLIKTQEGVTVSWTTGSTSSVVNSHHFCCQQDEIYMNGERHQYIFTHFFLLSGFCRQYIVIRYQ